MSVKVKTSAATASVASSATVVTLLSANSAAVGRCVFNDSTQVLYLKYGPTATTSDYTVQLAAGAFYEFPTPLYSGLVTGLWASANGNARLTEW